LATLIYNTYFAAQNAGFAAAIGFLLFVVILIITVIMQRIFKMFEVEY
jgi:ABC-type sugar transport system permease subunit